MGTISGNDFCPCGSGKKYKKCCLGKNEIAAPKQKPAALKIVPTDIDGLSNHANDLIRAGRWGQAAAVCQRLKVEFPEELDAEQRLGELYEAKGDYALALQWTQAALDKARANPDRFDPELTAYFEEVLAEVKAKLAP